MVSKFSFNMKRQLLLTCASRWWHLHSEHIVFSANLFDQHGTTHFHSYAKHCLLCPEAIDWSEETDNPCKRKPSQNFHSLLLNESHVKSFAAFTELMHNTKACKISLSGALCARFLSHWCLGGTRHTLSMKDLNPCLRYILPFPHWFLLTSRRIIPSRKHFIVWLHHWLVVKDANKFSKKFKVEGTYFVIIHTIHFKAIFTLWINHLSPLCIFVGMIT